MSVSRLLIKSCISPAAKAFSPHAIRATIILSPARYCTASATLHENGAGTHHSSEGEKQPSRKECVISHRHHLPIQKIFQELNSLYQPKIHFIDRKEETPNSIKRQWKPGCCFSSTLQPDKTQLMHAIRSNTGAKKTTTGVCKRQNKPSLI